MFATRIVTQDGSELPLDSETFIALTAGSSIVRVASSERELTLDLSSGLQLILPAGKEPLEAIVFIPKQDDATISARVAILGGEERAIASVIAAKIWHLEQLYAIFCLLENNDDNTLRRVLELKACPLTDLLPLEERLYIRGAGPGSFWLDLFTAAKRAPRTALNALSLVFAEGRSLVLRQVKATTDLKELDVELKKLSVAEKKDDVLAKKIEKIIEIADKIDKLKDPAVKEIMRTKFVASLKETLGPDADAVLKRLTA